MNELHQNKHEQLVLHMQALSQSISVLIQQIKGAQQEHQNTRKLLEGLASILGYEYSQDAKRWVKKEKLEELRKAP